MEQGNKSPALFLKKVPLQVLKSRGESPGFKLPHNATTSRFIMLSSPERGCGVEAHTK